MCKYTCLFIKIILIDLRFVDFKHIWVYLGNTVINTSPCFCTCVGTCIVQTHTVIAKVVIALFASIIIKVITIRVYSYTIKH